MAWAARARMPGRRAATEPEIPLSDLLRCTGDRWLPGIGDPTVAGWVTVALYLLAAGLSARAAGRARRRERVFWAVLCAALLALAVNKQFDMQSALTAAGRCLARAQGWYGMRRDVQYAFVLAVAGLGLCATLAAVWAMRRDMRRAWLALLGFGTLVTFVAIRAAGFHDLDTFIGSRVAGLRMNWVIEMGGTLMVAANAAVVARRR
jgi:hypothetical protein